MTRPFNDNLKRALELSREMIALADEGDRDRDDAACGLVYGLIRDMGYKLRKVVEEECARHQEAGKWE